MQCCSCCLKLICLHASVSERNVDNIHLWTETSLRNKNRHWKLTFYQKQWWFNQCVSLAQAFVKRHFTALLKTYIASHFLSLHKYKYKFLIDLLSNWFQALTTEGEKVIALSLFGLSLLHGFTENCNFLSVYSLRQRNMLTYWHPTVQALEQGSWIMERKAPKAHEKKRSYDLPWRTLRLDTVHIVLMTWLLLCQSWSRS